MSAVGSTNAVVQDNRLDDQSLALPGTSTIRVIDAIESDAGGNPDGVNDVDVSIQPAPKGLTPRWSWMRILSFAVLPAVALLLTLGAAYLSYVQSSARATQAARIESIQAAKDGAVAILTYTPSDVGAALGAARDRLNGSFRDSYTSLINTVVIPGAQQKQISATATVPAAASEIATSNHAVVLVFIDQSVVVGTDAASKTSSAVEVTLDKAGKRWLISGFDPK